MNAFFYGVALQWKLDIRSKTMLITCYVVPLLFYAFMGGIFTSVNPEARFTLIQSMTVFVVSMGALIGLPPSLVEIYGSDIQNVYKANGVPLYLGIVTQCLSALIHLLIVCTILFVTAPIVFHAQVPGKLPLYFGSLIFYIIVSLSLGSVLGLVCKTQAKLTMISQLVFLPSIMLSGILFPTELLPRVFTYIGWLFPAAWGNRLLTSSHFTAGFFLPPMLMLLAAIAIIGFTLSRKTKE